MEPRRTTWAAAIRLAITWSVIAATTAVVLQSLGVLSQPTIVLGVIVIGFTASWVRTGQVAQPAAVRCVSPHRPAHRVAVVPASRQRMMHY